MLPLIAFQKSLPLSSLQHAYNAHNACKCPLIPTDACSCLQMPTGLQKIRVSAFDFCGLRMLERCSWHKEHHSVPTPCPPCLHRTLPRRRKTPPAKELQMQKQKAYALFLGLGPRAAGPGAGPRAGRRPRPGGHQESRYL